MGDHPPITPMRCAGEGELSGDASRLYDYITRHFLATVAPDAVYACTTAEFSIGAERFAGTGNKLISGGFQLVMPWLLNADDYVPNFVAGQPIKVVDIVMSERETTPPDYLTEAELIGLMEKHGIGTDASMSTHIKNILDRNYVTMGPNRTLVPKTLGIALIHGFNLIDPQLVAPTMRSEIEKQLNQIAKGAIDFETVLAYALDIFKKKYEYFVAKIEKMNSLFEVNFVTIEESRGRPLSRCGKCSKLMKLIPSKPYRLHCMNCDVTYNLPQGGQIKLYMEAKCPFDGFEIVLFSAGGASGKTFPLCPYCYNSSPFDGKKGMSCASCVNPTCKHAEPATKVTSCPECPGSLIFDPTSGPKWKLVCNQCNYLVHFVEKAHKVKLLSEYCDSCESCRLMEVDFHKAHSPLPNGATLHTGCLFCDDVLNATTQSSFGRITKKKTFSGRGRGRGRGRRGGRRGRGRGGKPFDPKMTFHGF